MTTRILQFGTTGQLATELLRQAPRHDVALTALGRADADLAAVRRWLEQRVATG